MKNWRSFTGILRSTILALIMLGLVSVGSFEGLERATLFMRLQWRGPRPVSPSVLVIAIDEPSLAQWGQFPWDRRVYGKLLERLGQAKAVAFDIAFNEPGRHPGEDEELARTMIRKPVILPIYRAYGSGESDHVELQVPLSLYRKSAQALGIIQFSPRQESPLLAFHPVQHQNQAVFPSMALAMARLGGHGSSEPFYLNYPGPARSYPILSFKEALSLPLETFKNKYILVGATAAGLPETGYQTPFPEKGPIAGVELHAIALGNLLEGNGIKRLPPFLD
ncbi:MAG: CHASE2 domain-containing protein, partial [Bacteroidota bacterium]